MTGLRTGRILLVLLLLAGLAACVQTPADAPGSGPRQSDVAEASGTEKVKTDETTAAAEKTSKKPAENPKKPVKTSEKPAKPLQKTAKIMPKAPQIGDLKGVLPARLSQLLGQPSLRRTDPPAEHWRFDGPGCALHIFFYREADGHYRLRHAEAREAENGAKTARKSASAQPCLDALWRNRNGGEG